MKSTALHIVQKACTIMLRKVSREYRAYTDIMQVPYSELTDWRSGIGECVHTLFGLVRSLRPDVIVEIGSARGKSTCAMALACRMNGFGKVYTIDPHDGNTWADLGAEQGSYEFLRNRISDYGLGRYCEIIRATSMAASKHWHREIGFLFIDGDHTYEGVKSDFELFRQWLTGKALVAFHDTLWGYLGDHPNHRSDMGVPQFMEDLRRKGYHMATIWAVPGLTVMHPNVGGLKLWSTA
jgi:predicted O-methyltransferase YrrM